MREEFQNAVFDVQFWEMGALHLDFALQNAKAQFVIGGVQIDDQTTLQARFYAVLKVFDLARGAVCGDDDLFVLIDQRVEGVERIPPACCLCRR